VHAGRAQVTKRDGTTVQLDQAQVLVSTVSARGAKGTARNRSQL
jgi:hypothetical protein